MNLIQAFVKYASVLGVVLSVLALTTITLQAMSGGLFVFIATIGFLVAIVTLIAFVAWLIILTDPPDSGWFR